MKSFLLILTCLFLLNTSYAKDITFKVSKGGNLDAALNVGSIKVYVWNKDEVKITIDDDEASNLKTSSSGNTVKVNYNPNNTGSGDDLTITIPSSFNVKMMTNAGDVIIEGNLEGNVNINTAGGEVKAGDIKGDAKIFTGGGDVNIGSIGSGNISSAGGDIKLKNVEKDVLVKCSGGDIVVENVNNSADLNTAGGSILLNFAGGNSNITTGGGNINIGKLQKKSSVNTAGGDVNIKSAGGELLIQVASGDIIINDLIGSVKAKTLGGDIKVNIGKNYKGFSYFSTVSGNVHSVVSPDANVKVNVKMKKNNFYSEDDFKESIKSEYKLNSINKSGIYIEASFSVNQGNNGVSYELNNGEVYIKK
ncbi:MAG TPA: hypothetical protein VFF33_04305 [Ignavibacteriaceae bacterium]|nr:hypothetical protein [Ignavibacteriaceae bacterium]